MTLPAPLRLLQFSLRQTERTGFAAVAGSRKAIASQLLAVSLIYALCLQCVLLPRVAIAALSPNAKTTAAHKQFAENEAANDVISEATSEVINNSSLVNAFNQMPAAGEALPATITDAVVSKHKPTLNSGRIEGTLRVLLGESFTINGSDQITSDLYLPGTPAIQLSGAARYAGTVSDGGITSPSNYTVSLTGDVDLPGDIHTQVDPITLPTDFPASIPAAGGTRTVSIHSQSDIAGIGSWQTVRDLSVSRSGLTVNVPPGNYGTFTVNGNSRLNFTAGTYTFANTFNLDGSASIQATGLVIINVAKSLTVTSGALVVGSYTSPGDVRLNVLGPSVNVNGSSQISCLLRADNATVSINGMAQVRGQVIANSVTLNGGKVIGSVWPAHSGGSITTFGPRRFDRTTGPPNQYLEQFSLSATATSPYTLHIKNGALDGTNRVSSATVKLNGPVILSPSDLNQNLAGVDRTVTLASANTLEVSLASVPGSYLIIDIGGLFPPGDTTPPIVAITSPANNSTTNDSQIAVSVTASDPGPGASGVAHVYVDGQEATYNPGDNTWAFAGVALSIGANSIIAKGVDQSGNEATASITVTRETPNQPPVVAAGVDQNLALPQTATLHGTASDDGLPQGSTLLTSWSMIAGPGTVTFTDASDLNTIASFSSAGTYVLRLSVDDGVLSSSDDLTIMVQPQNQPPTVTAGPDQTIPLPHTATLNGSATDDGLPQDSLLTVAWSQVSGPGTTTFAEAYLTNTTASFSEPGTYVLSLSASDSELTSASELTVTVQPENQSPTVSAGPDQIVALPAHALLNGSAADDGWPAGSSLAETWAVVSGPAAPGIVNPNTTVTQAMFSVAGTYVLRLTASDGELSNSDELVITVDPQNQPPLVDAGPDQTITLFSQLNLSAVASDDGWPRNSNLTVGWSQMSGPGTATFAPSDAATTAVSFSAAGAYVLRLTASDSQLSAADELSVTVIDPRVPPVADFVVPESSGTAGSFVIASSGPSGTFSPDKILDNNINTFWTTLGVNNQFAKLQFFDQESVFIDRVRLQAANGVAATTCVRDFDVQVSSTNSNDASFVTVLSATLLNNGQLQEFVLPGGPARARYLRFVPKNNYGSATSIQLATFNVVAAGSADSIISLPGQNSVALAQSPSLLANGAAIYTSTYAGGALNTTGLNPHGLLGYNNGGWHPVLAANPSAIIQLVGGKLYTLKGVKLATMSGVFSSTIEYAVKDFEVWVSATTPDDAAFTKVLTATTTLDTTLQTFLFPGGPVQARYVKYVPLTNSGSPVINTQAFDVIAEGTARVVGSSAQYDNSFTPPEAAFDTDTASIWLSANGATTNVWVKTSLANEETHKTYGVRISPASGINGVARGPKDFDIRVSTTTPDDSAFTTVYSGTLAGTTNGAMQEFIFPDFIDAKYVQFFWKNGYSPGSNIGVSSLEVLAAPTRGSAIVGFSTQQDPSSNALDLDPSDQWSSALNNPTNQWLKLLLPKAASQTIRHIALRPAIATNGAFSAPKDFEFQVSTTDSADASFTTVLAGTLANSTQLQDFYFSQVPARYVRLLIRNTYGGSRLGLANFYVYSPDQIGSTTRFVDRSTDGDGQVVSWAWNFGDGATSTERHPWHTFPAPGDYTVSLTVTDNTGLTHSRQSVYRVLESLSADFAYSPIFAHEGGEAALFRDVSGPLTQTTTRRRYVFGDGITLNQASNPSSHTFTDSGVFPVTLNVGDPLGVDYAAAKDVVILNMTPTVAIDPGKILVWGEPWTSVPSIDDQGPVDRASLQGQWVFGDGQTSQCVNCTNANATVTHSYANPGTYTAVLTINDKDGAFASDSAVLTVNKRPVSLAFQDTPTLMVGQAVLLRVRLTDSYANQPLIGRTIQFNLNGATASATTDAGGFAEAQVTFAAGLGVNTATATFAEEDFYLGGSTYRSLPGAANNQVCTGNSNGTDFWLMFPGNAVEAGNLQTFLEISSEVNTSGTVTVPGQSFSQNFTVVAHTTTQIMVNAYQGNSDQIEARGIHVVSQQPVTVYGLNNANATVDAFLGLPTAVLGNNYVVLGYNNGGIIKGTQFGVVASANATRVTITPTVTVGSRVAGVPYNITLNQGQTYLLRDSVGATSDLSGTIVLSDKPIGVFGGHMCANIPAEFPYCDYVVEQLPPSNTWGTHFATMPLATRTKGDTFRFLAATNETHVFLNSSRIATLNRGQFFERIVAGPAEIAADQPILVAQYANSHQYDGEVGDPFMIVVPPLEHYLSAYTVTSLSPYDSNLINVVAPTSDIGAIVVNGAVVPAAAFVPILATGVSGAQLTVNPGTHTLSGPHPFGVYIYGFRQDVSYGYTGGACFSSVLGPTTLTLGPKTQSAPTGAQSCVTATVKDLSNTPVNNKNVTFSIAGAHPQTPPAMATNALGQAQVCYTSATAGDDVITATSGSSSDTTSVSWTLTNQPPLVNAGADQAIALPAAASLQGSATDDGLPAGTLTVSWSKVSGPGNVTFSDPSAAVTSATFAAPGVYVLRLTGGDTVFSVSDDVQITVAAVNQPPTADAGPDQTVALNANLVANGGNEDPAASGEIPGWTEVEGTTWTQASANSGSGFPPTQRGSSYFYSGNTAQAELRQDVDLSAYAPGIAAGTQQFELKAYLRSAAEALPDAGRVVVEYRNATNTSLIATLNSGDITSTSGWHLTEDTRVPPLGTGWLRIRLIATRNPSATSDAGNDAFFDSVSLRPIGAAAVKLNGLVTDDGSPSGSTLTATWNVVSGPAAVILTTPNTPISSATFTTAGTYLLRLTATDGVANTSDDVTVVVSPPNQPPVVNAGTNQTITLPATAALNGSITDDGQPTGSSVSVTWAKVSGPGVVSFADSHQAITTASFSASGSYVLRLVADDTEYDASADVTITVNAAAGQVNQPPAVNPGPNLTISLPTNTVTLNGNATDDGLPAGSTLTVTWSKISGPGVVTFGNANSAVTAAQFSAVGSYVLRLSASDEAYLVSADVGVILTPQNQAPTTNAGPDQTILLSQGAQLDGSAGDDGLPAGNLTTNWTKVSGPGAVTFLNPNVTITGALFSATGTYVLRLTAGDGALSASDDITITVIDNVAPPTVAITAPTEGSSVTEPSSVVGSVSSGAWVLEYSLDNDDNVNNRVWTTFATGNGLIANAELGKLDPTMMLNGLFDIRLSATDSYGQTSRVTIAVIVERNFKVGNFTVSFSDLNIPVAGLPIEVTRTYDSRDKRVGDFGFGWTLGLHNIRLEKSGGLGFKWYETVSQELIPNYCLEATGSHLVTVTFPGGKVFKFQAAVTPHCQRFTAVTSGTLTFTPMPGTHGTLEVVGSADFQVDGSIPGPVNLIGFGGGVDIFNSSLFKFTAEDGTAFVIDQRAGLQSIKDTNNNTVTVSAGGIIHSNGKSITFNRDVLGRIRSVVDPAGNAQTYTYDAAGDLVSYTDNETNTSVYTYDASHRLLTIHDPRGIQPIRNDYNAEGRLISHTDGFGKVITYLHDIPSRLETVTDRLGHQTRFEYDVRGNVLSKTDALGGVTTFTYDGNDNVLTETNALGKTTTYTYDGNDRRTSVTDPLGNVTQFTYNALGKVLTTTDPLNHVTTNTYNAAGNLLTTRDSLNNTTSFGYSVFDGQRTSMTDALTNLTSYTYTGGYLTKETDPLDHETTFTYDANGNRASQTVKRTNAQGQLEAITTSYEYDKLNRLRKTTFADGSFTQVEYNAIGQQGATIDQLGRRTEFTYDDMGRLTRTTYADGAFEETTYDAEGRRLTSKDRAGHVTSYEYDEVGRPTKTMFADNTFTSTTYDAAGQVLTTTDARGNVTHYEYDNAGRRTKVRNALNQETTFAYDAGGNQLSMTDALGHTTSYEYDSNNRRTKTTYADSTFASVVYDALGRTLSRTDQAGKTVRFIYDAPGRLTKVKDALNQETTYVYDELGQQISQTDANNHTTRFEYDQLGRRVKRILPAGQFETYSYQSSGNLQSGTDFNGKTTTFTYDLMRRLLTKVPDPSLNQPTVSFTYNLRGQRATMNDASGTTAYGYDIRSRLTSKQTPFGTLSYTYNEAGSLSTLRSANANGVSVDYGYDALNRLETAKDNHLVALNGGVTNYTYDAVGNLQGYSYPNGVSSSYAYNSLNRLTTMTVATTGSSLASYSYTLGPTGNRTSVTELSGRTVDYSYDDLYRLTGEMIANDPHGVNGSASYSYDPVGNRLNRSSSIAPVPSQSSTYDANDRLTSDSYDNNGNTTSAGGNSYAYDFENHLTSLNGSSVRYVYDGDGNRVAKSVGGVTTNYLIDTNNPTGYAQVVEELQNGAVVKSFTYGHDLISQRIVGGGLSFYGYDGHGSVRILTNAAAAITDTYDYDAFGNLIYRSGTTPNDYLYSGEQFDASLGFYYLRARYMNPGSGRFLSTDAVEGNRFDPLTLHKYTYVENNPANLIDPRGEFSATYTLASVVSNAISLCIQYQSLINAARLILAGLNLYLLATNETYRGNFLAGGPEFASTTIADDLGSIAAAPSRFSGSVFEASSVEPFAVRHATNYPQSVINGIDPTRLNINSRLGPAFYVAEDGQTAVNEVVSHDGTFTHIVRYEMNLSGQRVLDFTNPSVARTWGYSSTLSYDRTQMIAQQAARQRYTVIAYPAVQGAGTNFAVLKNFTEILRPMGVAPGP